ncbi:hypothetical protein P7H16_20250 [Paenibacillus larvae]|nr:hypothetical protein [Paenibacillus larvae]MDT2248776.1 hypothetical protein [Paenibacillus larvae]
MNLSTMLWESAGHPAQSTQPGNERPRSYAWSRTAGAQETIRETMIPNP